MKKRLAFALILLGLLGSFLYAESAWWRTQDASVRFPAQGEPTRSAAQPQIQIPMAGSDGESAVNWSELLAMLSVFAGVVGAIQWIVVRVLIDPMIRNQTVVMQEWAEEKFPTAKEFSAHSKADETHQQRMEREVDQIWERLNKSNRGA